MKKLVIGNDHAALEMRKELVAYLSAKGYEFVEIGTDQNAEKVDYAPFALKAAEMVKDGEVDGGILICGTGLGMALTANKVPGIRACVCSEPLTAMLSRAHNNTNILCFGARIIGGEMAKTIADTWLTTEFEDGGRHARRVGQIMDVEKKYMK